MTAEEYVKHYASGQGGFVSVSVDVALRAIEYAKQEAKQQMMKDSIDGEIRFGTVKVQKEDIKEAVKSLCEGDKVKLIVIKK